MAGLWSYLMAVGLLLGLVAVPSKGDDVILSSSTQDAFLSLTTTIEGMLHDRDKTQMSINLADKLMHGFPQPDGGPTFFHNASAIEHLESVVATLGPFVCQLPKKHSRDIGYFGAVLGGLIGNIIGDLVAGQTEIAREEKSFLSGLGGIAGAVASMSGPISFNDKGEFNLKMMGILLLTKKQDVKVLKRILLGSFKPHPQLPYIELKHHISSFLDNLAPFVQMLVTEMDDQRPMARSTNPDVTVLQPKEIFPHVDDKFLKMLRSTLSMSGLFGGIISTYVSQQYKDAKRELRNSLGNALPYMRRFIQQRSFLYQAQIFETIIDDLMLATETIGYHSGIFGFLMGKNLQSFPHIDPNTIIRSVANVSSKEIIEMESTIINKMEDSIDVRSYGDNTALICLKIMTDALGKLGILHQFGDSLPENLNYRAPFGANSSQIHGDKIDRLPNWMLANGERLTKWNEIIEKFNPNATETEFQFNLSDYNNSFDFTDKMDPFVLEYIEEAVQNEDIRKTEFLNSTLLASDLSQQELADMPFLILASLTPSRVYEFGMTEIQSVLNSSVPSEDLAHLTEFLSQLSPTLFNSTVDHINETLAILDSAVADLVLEEIEVRHGFEGIQEQLCNLVESLDEKTIYKYAVGTTTSDLIKCLSDYHYYSLNKTQRAAIAGSFVAGHQPSFMLYNLLENFSNDVPLDFLNQLPQEDVRAMIYEGKFANYIPCFSYEEMANFSDMIIVALQNTTSPYNIWDGLQQLSLSLCMISDEDVQQVLSKSNYSSYLNVKFQTCRSFGLVKEEQCEIEFHFEEFEEENQLDIEMGFLTYEDNLAKFEESQMALEVNEIHFEDLTRGRFANISDLVSGFTSGQLDTFPPELTVQVLHILSGDFSLSREKRRKFLEKILDTGYDISSQENITALGVLATELPLSVFTWKLMNDTLKKRPELKKYFSKPKRLKVLSNWIEEEGIYTVLKSKSELLTDMPSTVILTASNLLIEDVNTTSWNRMQALMIIQQHKVTTGSSQLTLDDFRTLGKVAIGLSCDDVSHIFYQDIFKVISMLDKQVAEHFSSDLANCFATKLYFIIRLRGLLLEDVQQVFGSTIPGSILLYMPHSMLLSVTDPSVCIAMVEKLEKTSLKHLSELTGSYIFSGILALSERCKELGAVYEEAMPFWADLVYNITKLDHNIDEGKEMSDHEIENPKKPPNLIHNKLDGNFFFKGFAPRAKWVSSYYHRRHSRSTALSCLDTDIFPNPVVAWHKWCRQIQGPQYFHKVAEALKDNLMDLTASVPSDFEAFLPYMPDEVLHFAAGPLLMKSLRHFDRIVMINNSQQVLLGDMTPTVINSDDIGIPFGENVTQLDFNPINKHFAEIAANRIIDYLALDPEFPKIGLSLHTLHLLGPAVTGLSSNMLQQINASIFEDAIPLLGRYKGWNREQLNAIKTIMTSVSSISDWSSNLLKDMGHLAAMLDISDINRFMYLDLETVGALEKVDWPTNELKWAIAQNYMNSGSFSAMQLEGFELVVFRSLLCGIPIYYIKYIPEDSMRFALPTIGKVHCFDAERIEEFKARADAILGDYAITHGVAQLGVLASAFTHSELKAMKYYYFPSFPRNALKIIPNLNAFSTSKLEYFGMENGAIVLSRKDIFENLPPKWKNTIFKAAFGANGALISSQIKSLRSGKLQASLAFHNMMVNMSSNVQMLFHSTLNSSSILQLLYGLRNPYVYETPPPPKIKRSIMNIDIKIIPKNTIEKSAVVAKFVNQHAEDEVFLDVLEGVVSMNNLDKEILKKLPPQFMDKVKDEVMKEISGDSLAEMLDSDVIAQDAPNLKKMLDRFDDTQLEESMAVISQKTKKETATMAKPAFAVQESIAEEFMQRNIKRAPSKNEQVSFLDKFVDVMCPFVSGMSPALITRLPMDPNDSGKITDCFAESYRDLDKAQRTIFAKYLMKSDQSRNQKINPFAYGPFVLDVSSKFLERKLSLSELNEILESGFADLDRTNANFKTFARSVITAIVQHNISFLYEEENLKKLGVVLCEYSFDQLRKQINSSFDILVAKAYVKMCGIGEISSEMQECTPIEKRRLKRCKEQYTQHLTTTKPKKKKEKVNVAQFKMMRTAAKTLLKEKNLTQLSTADVEDVASALGGLKPREIEEIPDSAILSAMSTIKTNKNLSGKQKRLMLKKARSAGLEITNQTKLADIGELVTAVGAKELRQIPAREMLSNIKMMTDKADSFTGPQRKSIIRTLQELSVSEMMEKDLGAFAAEIPLKKIKELKTVNLTMVKDKTWNRGQAAKLIEIANVTNDYDLDAVKVRELGTTVVGLKCRHIMNVRYDEILPVTVALDDSTEMSFDMDECIAEKLHFSKEVELGIDYLKNSSNPDLPGMLGSIPSDVALFFKPQLLNFTSSHACGRLVEKIGQANLDYLPDIGGVSRRKELALVSVECLMRSENRTGGDGLSEEEVFKLGDMLCDIPPDQITKIQDNATESALEKLKSCIPRFSREYVKPVVDMVHKQLGSDASAWTVEALAKVGPIVALLVDDEIAKIDNETFLEAFDSIVPPDDIMEMVILNSKAFYRKASEVLTPAPTVKNSITKRQTVETGPDFDQITALGDGNVNWTPEQLSSISDEDFANSLPVLGAIENWSDEATVALYDHMIQTFNEPETWEVEVISEAKHILANMSVDDILSLDLTDPDAVASLSEIKWNHQQRAAALAGYLNQNSKRMSSLTSDDITALGDIMCGSSPIELISLRHDVMSESMSELGYSECFEQPQSDVLFSIILMLSDEEMPDAPLLQEMGSLAAGLAVEELRDISLETMPFLKEVFFRNIDPIRIRDGLSPDQLATSGITNVATVMNKPDLFDVLGKSQRNALQMAAFGRILMPYKVESTTAAYNPNSNNTNFTGAIDVQLDNSGAAGTIDSMETPTNATIGSPGNSPYVVGTARYAATFFCFLVSLFIY